MALERRVPEDMNRYAEEYTTKHGEETIYNHYPHNYLCDKDEPGVGEEAEVEEEDGYLREDKAEVIEYDSQIERLEFVQFISYGLIIGN